MWPSRTLSDSNMKTFVFVPAIAAISAANLTAGNDLTLAVNNSSRITGTARPSDATDTGWSTTVGTRTTTDDGLIRTITEEKTPTTVVAAASKRASHTSTSIVEDKDKTKDEVPRIQVDLCRADDTDTCYSASLRAGRCCTFSRIFVFSLSLKSLYDEMAD